MIHSDWDIYVVKSKRKTISMQIDQNLKIIVRAPLRMSKREIADFISQNESWIVKHMEKMENRVAAETQNPVIPLSMEEIRALARQAQEVIPKKVDEFSRIIGVSYGRITIRNQKTRWGSCSGKGNLNFNCLLMLAPDEIVDYVVVHELCHRLEMNHSARFWQQVEAVMPDYKKRRKWLKDHGNEIMRRMI